MAAGRPAGRRHGLELSRSLIIQASGHRAGRPVAHAPRRTRRSAHSRTAGGKEKKKKRQNDAAEVTATPRGPAGRRRAACAHLPPTNWPGDGGFFNTLTVPSGQGNPISICRRPIRDRVYIRVPRRREPALAGGAKGCLRSGAWCAPPCPAAAAATLSCSCTLVTAGCRARAKGGAPHPAAARARGRRRRADRLSSLLSSLHA